MARDDSYASLARSIERALRTDLAGPPASPELAQRIDRALLAEAHTGERRVAALRTAIAVAAALAALWTASASSHSAARRAPIVLVAWALIAAALFVALRRGWYRRWLRFATPLFDAAVVSAAFLPWARGADVAATATMEALCAFLAASGGLRLSASSARLSSGLAIGVFAAGALTARLEPAPALATLATLAALGALSAGVGPLVRRVVTDEVGRVELARLYDEARQAVDAREEVLKIVSHDLRNPLSTVSMSAQLMLETPLPEPLRVKQLTVIQRSTERMNRMIQDLLDVAKFEAGRLSIDARPLDVAALLAESEETLRPLASAKQLRYETVVRAPLPPCMGDQGRVLQLLGNLVGNAVKFTPAGGRITVRAEDVGGVVRFAVADTGAGIPPQHLSQVFGRLWQGNRADRRGIGLGLAISKGIVEAHGGRIWVESRVGEGTTFYFTLGSGSDAMAS